MIYSKHNFTENFLNAVGTDNEFIAKQIIIDELGRLIVEDKKSVVSILRNHGIGVRLQDSPIFIANFLTSEIAKGNKKIINDISILIAENNVSSSDYQNFLDGIFGTKEERQAKRDGGGGLMNRLSGLLKNENFQEGASSIISNVLSNTFNKNKPSETQKNQEVLDNRLVVNEVKQVENKTNKKLVFGIIGVSLLATSIITILIVKNKN